METEMQTGNFFTLGGITDPEGDPLRVLQLKTFGTPTTAVDADGYLTKTPENGLSGTRVRVKPNGDFIIEPGAIQNTYGTTIVWVDVLYTDDKAANHTASAAIDQTVRWNISITGDLGENQPPTAPAGNVLDTTYTPDP